MVFDIEESDEDFEYSQPSPLNRSEGEIGGDEYI